MSNEQEKIIWRRIALRKEYSHEYGLSFEEAIIQKLVEAEDEAAKLYIALRHVQAETAGAGLRNADFAYQVILDTINEPIKEYERKHKEQS